jgi:magnesium-transporting ATPase (P-type)
MRKLQLEDGLSLSLDTYTDSPSRETDVTISSILQIFERSGSESAALHFHEAGDLEPYVQAFDTDLQSGLPQDNIGSTYDERKLRWGVNILPNPPQTTWCGFFVEAFRDLMLRILLICAVASLALTIAFP